MTDEKLYPSDGMRYDLAMMAAEKEYRDWLRERKVNRGITIYSRKALNKHAGKAE